MRGSSWSPSAARRRDQHAICNADGSIRHSQPDDAGAAGHSDVESAAEGYRQDGGGYIDKADTGRMSSLWGIHLSGVANVPFGCNPCGGRTPRSERPMLATVAAAGASSSAAKSVA